MPIPFSQLQRFTSAFLLAALSIPPLAHSAETNEPARFSGQANLTVSAPASSDGRFQLDAALSATEPPSGSARFTLNAKLKPDPKSVTGTCAPLGNTIFRNGFE